MQESLRRIANRILFEDTWNERGSQYMSQIAGEESEDLPVDVSDAMPNRLAIETPPVEDDEYMPSSSPELSSALAAIGQAVPSEDVEKFYKFIRDSFEANSEGDLRLVNQSRDNQEPSEEQEEVEASTAKLQSDLGSSGELMKYEARLRKIIREMLEEQAQRYDDRGKIRNPMSNWDVPFSSRSDDEEEEEYEEVESSNKEELKGKYVAKYYNKAGPSGVTLGTQRLMQNFLKHMYEVSEQDIEDASDYLAFHIRETVPGFEDQNVFQTVRSKIFKKVIKRLVKNEQDISKDFLEGVVKDVMKLRSKEVLKMVKEAEVEKESEQKAFSDLVDFLEKEDPQQYQVMKDLFGKSVK